jgi:precorrin-6B methylase 2
MTGWNGGYVTDISYLAQSYVQQSAHYMGLTCLMMGVATDVVGRTSGHHIELGCGRGMSAMVFAAANPGWRVTAVDFMPGSIAEARQLCAAARLENITFIEADLASFAETEAARTVPMADTVTLHGVWSWVPEAVRHGIVRLLLAKVVAGGLVHVSYNTLPGLQGALAFQRVIRETGLVLAHRSDEQALAGLQVARDLVAAGARQVAEPSIVRDLIERLSDAPSAYLAHEYMNAVWHPCFHNDVADVMAGAKLDFVGEGSLLSNFSALQMTPEQIAIADRFGDNQRLRQLIMDCCRPQGLRHDIYVRGARQMSREE